MCEDLTIVCCSYNTPDVFELCLESFVFHHGPGPHKIIIVENSTDAATQEMLDSNNIPCLINSGGTHSPSVELGAANRSCALYEVGRTKAGCFLQDGDAV